MYTQTYTSPKTFLKYDGNRYMVYLNEVVIPDYVEPHYYEYSADDDFEPTPVTGYQYTGSERDGGTLIECQSPTRNELINGIIRSRYSQTEEDAIKTHQIQSLRMDVNDDKSAEYEQEWSEFNAFRAAVIAVVDSWL